MNHDIQIRAAGCEKLQELLKKTMNHSMQSECIDEKIVEIL